MDPRSQVQPQASSNVVGKYRLIAELGRGGMSEVYLAVHAGPAGFNKLVVVKLIRAEIAEDPDFVNMFLEEARLAARLNHPNVVQTNEVGHDGSRYFIAMEYLDGQPYSRILNRLGRDRGLPLGMSLRILVEVLQGLQHAHDLHDFDGTPLGVVHRDVTPHNVFVTYDGQVKVVDFGIAKAMNSSLETRTGVLKGKVGYMAPEQARGERVDRRADVFSVGVMLWEAAVGRRLWKGMNEVAVLSHLLRGEIPPPRSMRPDISEQLEAIILRALAPDREQRYASADAMRTALEDLVDAPGERSTIREMGRMVSEAFSEDKRRLKQIIESQLQRSSMLSTGTYQGVQLPVVEQAAAHTGELAAVRYRQDDDSNPNRVSMSGAFQSYPSSPTGPHQTGPHPFGTTGPQNPYDSGPHSTGRHSTASGSTGANPLFQGSGAYQATGSGSFPNPVPALYPQHPGSNPSSPQAAHGSHPSHPTHSGPLHMTTTSGQAASHGSKVVLAGIGIGVVAIGLGAVLFMGKGPDPVAPAAAPSASVVAAATTASAEAKVTETPVAASVKEVPVRVEAAPSSATILIDGKPVDGNPWEGTFPKDGATHEIRVEADGHEPQTKSFVADRGVNMSLALAPSPRRPSGNGGARVPPPPTNDDVMKRPPVKPPQRTLDENPY